MRTVVITLTNQAYSKRGGDAPAYYPRAVAHFAERGLDVEWFLGIDAARIGLNMPCKACGAHHVLGPMPTGCMLSHRSLWAAILLGPDAPTMVLETDAQLHADWRPRLDRALEDVQRGDPGWEMLWTGSCCCAGHPMRQLAGEVFAVDDAPQCTHAYVVRGHGAARTLCERVDELGCQSPIDCTLARSVLPSMRSYVVLPRLVDQFDTELSP
jgi:GR25 family glycosyltransferase involved in LPS biosynthesis